MNEHTDPPSRLLRALRRIKPGGVKNRLGSAIYVGVGHMLYNREDAVSMPIARRDDQAERENGSVIPVRVTELDGVLTDHARLSDLRGTDLGWFHLDQYRFYRPVELVN
jgi:hypothetical protein